MFLKSVLLAVFFRISFFLWLNTLLYVYAIFCWSIHNFMSSWVVAYLLAIVNSAALKIGIQVFVQVPAFSSSQYIPGSGLTKSLYLTFWGVDGPFYSNYIISHSSQQYRGFQYLHIFLNACYFLGFLFCNIHSNRHEVVTYYMSYDS